MKIQKPKRYGVYILCEGQFYAPSRFTGAKAEGVLLYTKHARIVIDPQDLKVGEEIWATAMLEAKDKGKQLPSAHEAMEIVSNMRKIRVALRKIGGEEFIGWYLTRTEVPDMDIRDKHAWCYCYAIGLSIYDECYPQHVRAVTVF